MCCSSGVLFLCLLTFKWGIMAWGPGNRSSAIEDQQRCIKQCTLRQPWVSVTALFKLLHHFCVCWTQSLGSKWPLRTQLSDGVGCKLFFFWFSLRKFGVFFLKVGIIAFFGCSEFQCTKLTFILEEKLVVIIFHCRYKNMKKLIESSLSPGWSSVRAQSFFHIFSWFLIKWTHIKINVKLVANKWVNQALCWLIFLIDAIVENIKFSLGFDKVWRRDQTCSSFSVNVSESLCLFGNGI